MDTNQIFRRVNRYAMNTAVVYILISVVGGAIGQVMLKKGMSTMGPLTLSAQTLIRSIWQMVTNPWVFFGLLIYGLGTVFWLAALSRVDLSYAYPFASLSYVVMLIFSYFIFHESISLLRIAGTVVIIIGVLLISRS